MDQSVDRIRKHIIELLDFGFTVTEINATNGYVLMNNEIMHNRV
jgi:hypothetical protein